MEKYENRLFLTDSKLLKAGVLAVHIINIQMQPLCALCNRLTMSEPSVTTSYSRCAVNDFALMEGLLCKWICIVGYSELCHDLFVFCHY